MAALLVAVTIGFCNRIEVNSSKTSFSSWIHFIGSDIQTRAVHCTAVVKVFVVIHFANLSQI